jgi:hypothetical protein
MHDVWTLECLDRSNNSMGEEENNHVWGLGCCHSIHDIFATEVSSAMEKCSQHA